MILMAGVVVFHHLVWMKDVGAHLASPFVGGAWPQPSGLWLLLPLFLLLRVDFCFQERECFLAVGLLERSLETCTDMPGRLVRDAHRRLALIYVLSACAA